MKFYMTWPEGELLCSKDASAITRQNAVNQGSKRGNLSSQLSRDWANVMTEPTDFDIDPAQGVWVINQFERFTMWRKFHK